MSMGITNRKGLLLSRPFCVLFVLFVTVFSLLVATILMSLLNS